MPVLAGTEIASLAQMGSLLRSRPELARVRLQVETRKRAQGAEASRIVPNEVIQGSGGALIAEDLLLATARCLAYDFTALAAYEGVPLDAVTVRVAGELDLRSAAGDTSAPAGFLRLEIRIEVASRAAPVELTRVGSLAERTSVALQSLRAVPRIFIVTSAPVADVAPKQVKP